MKTYRIAVTGGRDHKITEEEKKSYLRALRAATLLPGRALVVLHGNCRGVDQRAAELADQWCYPTVPFEAPWDFLRSYSNDTFRDKPYYCERTKRLAGPLRNWVMLQAADLLIAFPGGRGTANCIRQAQEKGIEVVRIGGEG